jgi:TPP-dependent pyruvate/acetoin dehydrogenase alpha subunit
LETVKINGHDYTVSILPLDMTPYTMLYSDLVRQKPKDIAEVKQMQEKLKEIIKAVLDATVKEPRQAGDDVELFSHVTSMTAKKIREQEKLFREPQESSSKESS